MALCVLSRGSLTFLLLFFASFPKPPEYIKIIAIMRENEETQRIRRKGKTKNTILAIPSFKSTGISICDNEGAM